MTASSALQLSGFLADLVFVGCLTAAALYAIWLAFKRKEFVGLGRLSLVVAFGASIALFAEGAGPLAAQTHGFAYPVFFVFILLALFLLLEFLFQMSILGLLVSLVGVAIAALHYLPVPTLHDPLAPNAAVAYWWVMRDIAMTTGAAVLTLGLGTAALLNAMHGKRPNALVHPNDLRDVAAFLARGAVPCFFAGLFASAAGLFNTPHPHLADWWGLACQIVLLIASLVWLGRANSRRFSGGRVLSLVAINALALLGYALGTFLRVGA